MRARCRSAVILAAGCGSRVRTIASDKPKCLMPLAGKPIIEWILRALEAAGIEEVVVVTGFHGGAIRRALRNRPGGKPSIKFVDNPRWRLPNGVSLYVAGSVLDGRKPFLLLMSDHLVDEETIRRVAAEQTSKCLLAVDTSLGRIFDLGDATKVRIERRRPVAIGKKLRKYNAVDCGLFRLDKRVFGALEAAFREGEMSLTDGIRRLVALGDLEVLPIRKGARWLDIDTPSAYRHACRHTGAYLAGSRCERTGDGEAGPESRTSRRTSKGKRGAQSGRR